MLPDVSIQLVKVIDSHTGGEPTRVVVSGGPQLPAAPMAECRELLQNRYRRFLAAVIDEPRGSDVVVGAMLCPAADPSCVAGVVFFNNVGVLNMCGHGTIGVAATLAHLGRIAPGKHRLETPVGIVGFELHDKHRTTIQNVPAYRFRKDATVEVEGYGPVTGDVAWGGNWFFLVGEHGQVIEKSRIEELTRFTCRIRQALEREGVAGENGGLIDHIELFGPPSGPHADSKNFVLCPGRAYDRSPCGTGTSAKLACLAEDGKLQEGALWRQESIIGSIFEARYRRAGDRVVPEITGTAYVNAESTLIIDPDDPFAWGIE